MFQITNSSYRFRKKTLNSKTRELPSFTVQNRGESHPNYFQNLKNSNNISLNLSLSKNIKMLPKLQINLSHTSNISRYAFTPLNENSFELIQTNQGQSYQKKSSQYFVKVQKSLFKNKINDLRTQSDFNTKPSSEFYNQIYHQYLFVNKQGKRPYNEDRFVCKNDIQKFYLRNHLKKQKGKQQKIDFYSVFDGHGGVGCAQFLKDNFINFLIRTKNLQSNPEESLREAFKLAEQKFLSICQSRRFSQETSGSCAVSCIVTDQKVIVGNVGDCRAIMFNKDFLCEMTKDHKPTQLSQKMRILKCGGKVFKEQIRLNQMPGQPIKFFTVTRIAPGNLNVSRTIGDIETKIRKYGGLPGMISAEPEIKTFEKGNYEILLLASDGLFEAFSNSEIQKLYYKTARCENNRKQSIFQKCKIFLQILINEALEKSSDNITVILVPLNFSKED